MREGWNSIQLGDVCDFVSGFAFKSELFKAQGLPIIRISNIQNNVVIDDDLVYFSPNDYSFDFTKYRVSKGDILIAMSGATTGKTGIIKSNRTYYLNQRVGKFIVKDNDILNRLYLFYYLHTLTDKILGDATGVAQPNISGKQILNMPMLLPPIKEQERIVAELDLLSGIIDKQKAQLKELDNLAQSIFYDMFGNPVENEKGWKTCVLNDVCSDITDGSHNPPKGGIKSEFMMLSSKNIFDGYYTLEEPRYLSEKEYAVENKRTNLKKGDILLTIVGTIGRCCVFDGANQVALQRSVAVLKPEDSISSAFLMKQLQISRAVLENEAKGVAQKGIYLNQLKRLRVLLPPISLQQAFAKKMSIIDAQKETINLSIAESQKLFDYTMDKYFS